MKKMNKFFMALVLMIHVSASSYFKFDIENPLQSIKFIRNYLPKDPIILEAGAYDGKETIKLMQFWLKGTVYSFEPVPQLYEKLLHRTRQYNRIHVYPQALSDKIGTAQFHVSSFEDSPDEASASSSLLQPKEHFKYAPIVHFDSTITVPTTTIDAWADEHGIDHIDFMWLDMQGAELQALKAAPKMLKTVKVILTEVEFIEAYKGQPLYQEIKTWLEAQGFEIIGADVDLEKPNHWFGDVLFVRR